MRARRLSGVRVDWATLRESSSGDFLPRPARKSRTKFPILLKKVATTDAHRRLLPANERWRCCREVDLVLGSSDILTDGEHEFFDSMKRLCEASSRPEIRSVLRRNSWHGSHGFPRINIWILFGRLLSCYGLDLDFFFDLCESVINPWQRFHDYRNSH